MSDNLTGWLRQPPDPRDYTTKSDEIAPLLKKLKLSAPPASLPATVDLRAGCSPIENQGALGSCTAHAGVGLVEFIERKAYGNYIDGSHLFVYKTTRSLLGWTGDTGAYLRTTMGALALMGVPPQKYWPYVISKFDVDPPSFVYALGQNFQAIRYYTLDPVGTPTATVLANVKAHVAAGLPSMFGFTCFSSLRDATTTSTGEIPFPVAGEGTIGGHAILAVGYNDSKVIVNHRTGAKTTGALLIRNSWGTSWGMSGYGWLPYEYVLRGAAVDFWTLLSQEYVATGKFGF